MNRWVMVGKGRWVLLGAGAALGTALLAAATSPVLQSPGRDWGPAARAAAEKSILDRAPPDGNGVQFAGVEVRRNGNDDERWVCGSFAVWGEDGSLGPYRDFLITVARVPETRAAIRDVRVNGFGRDAFLDRNSAHFRACFAGDGVK